MFVKSNHCRLCKSKKIKIGLDLGSVKIAEKYSHKKFKKIPKFPLSIGACSKCKNIQTMEIVDLKFLWQDYTYLSGQTPSIVNHFKDISTRILEKQKIEPNDYIIDIGSNDGTLLKNFHKKMNVLGVDGAKNVAKIANRAGIKTINKFFDHNLSKEIKNKNGKAKIITCFNSFAHTPDLNTIIKGIKNLLDENGIFVFECQYLGDIYKNKIIGTFFHEHLYHHSLTSLNNLCNSHGLNFYHVEKANIQKGSIIGYISIKKIKKTKIFKELFKREKTMNYLSIKKLESLKKYIITQKNNFKKLTKDAKPDEIAYYGSARSAPIFIENYGMENKVKYLFDDHKLKIGKFSPLTNQKVLPTNRIYKKKIKIIIILAYLHSKKIIKKNLKFIKNGGKFIIAYPEIIKVDKSNYKKII